MDQSFHLTLVVVVAAVLSYFFARPLRMLSQSRYSAHAQPKVLDVAQSPLPPVYQQQLDAVEEDLVRAGFEPYGTFLLSGLVTNCHALFRAYVNRESLDGAIVTSMFAMNAVAMRHVPFVQFSSRYSNGWWLSTGNANMNPIFPARPNALSIRVPWIENVNELYQVHRSVALVKAPPGAHKTERLFKEFDGDVEKYYAVVNKEELAAAAQAGYLRLEADGEQYRPTIKGAFLMTWKLLPPIKQVYRSYCERSTRRLLAEAGVV